MAGAASASPQKTSLQAACGPQMKVRAAPEDLPEGLCFYPDSRPGIARRRCGRGFSYTLPDGTTLARGPERARIEALGIPPAYEEVWISPRENGHLQATGLDARTRKQYRYHPLWSEARAAEKFETLTGFGHALPRIRRAVTRDLAEGPGEMSFALAAAVLLIDRLAMRVGNAAYTQANGSYGALTLRRRQMRLCEDGLRLSYTAKGGKKIRRRLTDRKLLKVLDQARDLPGAELITWIDEDGAPRALGSDQLNAYLSDLGQGNFTAKTFRTWSGSLAAFEAAEAGGRTIKALSGAAAARLNNTPTVARNSYIHPKVIALAEARRLPDLEPVKLRGLSAAEARLLALLESPETRG
ncbi:DNA topoisomerase IB [Thioclava sp. GXIMD4216]